MKFGEVGLEIIEVCRVAASVVSEVFDDPLAELKIGQDSQDSVNSVGESF